MSVGDDPWTVTYVGPTPTSRFRITRSDGSVETREVKAGDKISTVGVDDVEEIHEGDPVRTEQVESGAWVVSHHQCWIEGSYATEAAARRAPFVSCCALSELWGRVRPGAITEADLDQLQAEGS